MRFGERLPVRCSVAQKAGNIHRIYSSDISGEGICLQVPEMLPQKTILDLKVDIPYKGSLAMKGEVVWVKEAERASGQSERLFDTGVRFIQIRPEDKACLGNYLISIMEKHGR